MPKILVVDDHAGYRATLRVALEKVGYQVVELDRGCDVVTAVSTEQPDVVLLDLDLPDTSGSAVCAELKRLPETRAVPVIIVTGKAAEENRIEGFEAGADDFVVKPFSLRELSLRLRVILERRIRGAEGPFRFGALTVYADAHRVFVDGREAELTRVELAVLRALCESARRVLSREDLLDKIWGLESEVPGLNVDGHVSRLRRKLGRAGAYIQTVQGAGYRLDTSP